jgi:hypothetical protein
MTSAERIAAIIEALSSPGMVSNEAGMITNRSLRDQIEADKYLSAKEAATNRPKNMGVRLGRFTPPEHF